MDNYIDFAAEHFCLDQRRLEKEDIAQEIRLKFLERERDPKARKAYIWTTAKNTVIDQARKLPPVAISLDGIDVEAQMPFKDPFLQERILEEIMGLPPLQSYIATLHFIDGITNMTHIAHKVDRDYSKVRRLLDVATKTLRRKLKKEYQAVAF